MPRIVDSSDLEYSREEEERVFMASLESPRLSSMHPAKPDASQVGRKKILSRIPKPANSASRLSDAHSVSEEQAPIGREGLRLSLGNLPTFDTPSPASRHSLELDLSDLGDDAELDSLADHETPVGYKNLRPKAPSPFKSRSRLGEADENRLSNGRLSGGRNLIELDESASNSTSDLKSFLQKSKSHFERSLHNVKESSPSSKLLAKESPEIQELVQPRKLPFAQMGAAVDGTPRSVSVFESSPIISNHLTFPDRRSPHAGSFRPVHGGTPRSKTELDDSITMLETQLKNIQADMVQKKYELDRLKREKASLDKTPFWKRLLLGFFFLALFALFDFVLRVVVTQQQFDLGAHIDLDQVTAFYKNYLDLGLTYVQDLRAKGTIPF